MIDLKMYEQQLQVIKTKLQQRNFDLKIVDEIINHNTKRKELLQVVENARAQIKKLSQEVGTIKKNGGDATEIMKQVEDIKTEMKTSEQTLSQVQVDLNSLLLSVPNLAADDVPVGKSEDDNSEIHCWGEPKKFDFAVKDHSELGEKLGLLDFEIAAKITGSRFAVYKGALARMERALANFMMDFHLGRGFQEIIPPYIAHERSLVGTGNLPKFAEDLFKLEQTPWYLIPTAEVPLTNLLREQIVNRSDLPKKYAAFTPCFRSEAGSYGKDTKGLIRMHQFHKVEMVCITDQESSETIHQHMIDGAQKILELLELPYRSIVLCTGDMGFSSRKTIDLEVWLPAQNTYREISSISNCGDFQSRRASIRYRGSDEKPTHAHTLNGSGLAVGRTLVAIMENYQQIDGTIIVPEVLRPYMGGITVIKG